MPDYTVYRSGEDEPVGGGPDASGRGQQSAGGGPDAALSAQPGAAPAAGPSAAGERPPDAALSRVERRAAEKARQKHGDGAPSGTPRGRGPWLAWGILLVLLVAAGAAIYYFQPDALGNLRAAFDLTVLTGKVPGWALYGAPGLVALVIILIALYFALGHHVSLKVLGLVIVALILAVPGAALGYVNGTVSVVSTRTVEVKTVVEKTKKNLRPALPGKAVNVLLIGRDRDGPDDPGRSDTQILMRLDPDTKSISMLSLPRDLRVLIPGVGYDKMNAAFSYGGPALVVKTFTELTGLPINHFVEVDFAGFWHSVNILDGVYIAVDHRYYNPESSSYKSIDIEPGYQLMRGHDALDFVRYRHDNLGDFGRMQRQQLFLKEMQRQSSRWSKDWTKVTQLIKELTAETTSDVDSLQRIKPLVELVFEVDTSKFATVHLEGSTPMIDGISYVVASDEQIAAAVKEFTNPEAAPVQSGAAKLKKKDYTVTVFNGSGQDGFTEGLRTDLRALGYHAYNGAAAPEFPGSQTTVYAPAGLEAPARTIANLFAPAKVKVVSRAPGSAQGLLVFVASSFDGTLDVPSETPQIQQTLVANANTDAASWKALAKKTPMPLEMPSTWVSGCVYDGFRAYKLPESKERSSSAAVAVARTPYGNYWSIQAMRWLNPPAIANPNGKETINGQEYLLFYQGRKLHMVAWKRNNTLYWVLNTLNNELSEKTMRALATSCKPVK